MEDMDAIYQEYAQTVYKYLMATTHDADLAEELCQETFYQAVKSIQRFDGSCKISVWLCQIAKHQWYQYLKKHHREIPTEEIPEMPIKSAEQQVMADVGKLELLQKIHALPEAMKEVVYLRAFGGLSFREIGEVTGHTENWARVTFYRGKEKLKGEMTDE